MVDLLGENVDEPVSKGPRGMFDASCTKCKRRFGWKGPVFDKPPCPKCGHHDKVDANDPDVKAVLDFQEVLRKRMLEH